MKRKFKEEEPPLSKCGQESSDGCSAHRLNEPPEQIRSRLLFWYDAHKRDLPWRKIAEDADSPPDLKGYSVWISEVMLQQTQVATVIDYYNRWMKAWPTVSSLASADLDSVNRLWSGLGYYSRARRLLEGAQKIVAEYGSSSFFPCTREELLKIPGVGKYTASAIASIAFGHPVGVVDGNVVRVVSRLRALGKDSSSKEMIQLLWKLSDELVDRERPGDFNQSLMELGATVCTPKNPSCQTCPLSKDCAAYNNLGIKMEDIENCHVCIETYDPSKGVMNYPVKLKKARVREETCLSVVLKSRAGRYILFQRPSKGLLANLLEFYSLPGGDAHKSKVKSLLEERLGVQVSSVHYVGDVFHQFSHISQTYKVWSCLLEDNEPDQEARGTYQSIKSFESHVEILSSSISTAMKKVLRLYLNNVEKEPQKKKQRSITTFFEAK